MSEETATTTSEETWNVLVPSDIHPAGLETLEEIATITSRDEYGSLVELTADATQFDAMVVRIEDVPTALLEAAERLQVIAKHGVGVDNIDLETASDRGIIVCNAPGANTQAVAEHAVALLLAVRKQLLAVDAHVRDGDWDRDRFLNRELEGTTLGLLGCGDIASGVADRVRCFGMDCLAFDPYVDEDTVPDHVTLVTSKEALFEAADHVSVHTPLTEETHNLVARSELELLSPEGILINTSRGGVVDEAVLGQALERGSIAGAGLDVFAEEPLPEDHPFLESERVILTPHLGALTEEAMRRMSVQACANVRTVYGGGIPETTVNRAALELE